jgi:hypothetical protein
LVGPRTRLSFALSFRWRAGFCSDAHQIAVANTSCHADGEMAIDERNLGELTIDELDAVSGGDMLKAILGRGMIILEFLNGTITDHATTLP